jgi:aerobic-type carbon monoxide dehydrogenase small subunit (CoxS/CutS family)
VTDIPPGRREPGRRPPAGIGSGGCLTDGKQITAIEGLGTSSDLHPMQQAFVAQDALQCGYCTPGQVCSAVAMLEEVQQG